MAYRVRREESVEEAVRRIAREQIEGALADIDGAAGDVETAVHEVRKCCKKVRGLLRLVRPGLGDTYGEENVWFRDTARWLSGIRDLQVMGRTLDAVCAHYADQCATRRFRAIRERLHDRVVGRDGDPEGARAQLAELRPALAQALERSGRWRVPAEGFAALEPGLRLTYRRGRRALNVVAQQPSRGAVHEWRKRAKYHWYHARLLVDCWPPVMEGWRDEANRLAEGLGDVHDLAVLRHALATDLGRPRAGGELRALIDLVDRRQGELLAQALARGRRLYAERPRQLTARLGRYWNTWRTAA